MPTVRVAYDLEIPEGEELDSDEPVQIKLGEWYINIYCKASMWISESPSNGRYFRLRDAQPTQPERKSMNLTELHADIVAAKGDNCPGSRMHDRLCEWSKVVASAIENTPHPSCRVCGKSLNTICRRCNRELTKAALESALDGSEVDAAKELANRIFGCNSTAEVVEDPENGSLSIVISVTPSGSVEEIVAKHHQWHQEVVGSYCLSIDILDEPSQVERKSMNLIEEIRSLIREIDKTRSETVSISPATLQRWGQELQGCVPVQGPPDGYARLGCGTLAKIGMTAYRNDGSEVLLAILYGDYADFSVVGVPHSFGGAKYSELFAAAPVKPEPVTAETQLTSALSLCLHVLEKGFAVRLQNQWPALKGPMDDVIAAAKAVLAKAKEAEPVFTCPKCGGRRYVTLAMGVMCENVSCLWQCDDEQFRAACKPVDSIPPGVYWSEQHDCFYSSDTRFIETTEFHRKWRDRRSEFPTDPRVKS